MNSIGEKREGANFEILLILWRVDQSMQYVSSIKFVAVYLCNRIISFSFNTPLFNINAVLTGKTGWLYKDSKLKQFLHVRIKILYSTHFGNTDYWNHQSQDICKMHNMYKEHHIFMKYMVHHEYNTTMLTWNSSCSVNNCTKIKPKIILRDC